MIRVRRAAERGSGDHGWLKTQHTFSFADYHDPAHQQFRALRVMNEDWIAAGQGFGMHPHRDMEILTCVLSGALEHRDSLGNGEVLRPGEFQRMSAGTGIRHSEFNPSATEPTHLYQIWLLPDRVGITPEYQQRAFPREDRRNCLQLIASPDGADDSLRIHQDVRIYSSVLDPDCEVSHAVSESRHAWLQVLDGDVRLNGRTLGAGDGAAVSDESRLSLQSSSEAEVLLFDLC